MDCHDFKLKEFQVSVEDGCQRLVDLKLAAAVPTLRLGSQLLQDEDILQQQLLENSFKKRYITHYYSEIL